MIIVTLWCSSLLISRITCPSDALLLQEDLVDLVPMVEEANAISMELDRKVI
jgi:hypothetical protein